uniref:NADH dehydrogenase subunit 6 n=1 Tax=Cacopsylla melanoneura TaxID=428564 RepID=A0A8D8YC22_9HEMI
MYVWVWLSVFLCGCGCLCLCLCVGGYVKFPVWKEGGIYTLPGFTLTIIIINYLTYILHIITYFIITYLFCYLSHTCYLLVMLPLYYLLMLPLYDLLVMLIYTYL